MEQESSSKKTEGPTVKRLLLSALAVCIASTAFGQVTITTSQVLGDLGPTLVLAVLDSTRSELAPQDAYFTKDGRFIVMLRGPEKDLKSIIATQYDKEKIDPEFVDFMATILGNAFGQGSEPQQWITREGKLDRPEARYYRKTTYKGVAISLMYNVDRVPFQLFVNLQTQKK
jgi:hypothetical protein